jgi:hypothetical protein
VEVGNSGRDSTVDLTCGASFVMNIIHEEHTILYTRTHLRDLCVSYRAPAFFLREAKPAKTQVSISRAQPRQSFRGSPRHSILIVGS